EPGSHPPTLTVSERRAMPPASLARHFVTGDDTCHDSGHHSSVAMKLPRISLRWLLGAVTILASLMFVVSVVSLSRLIRMSAEQRLERGRDLVQRELARWAAEPDPTGGPTRFTVLGIRGGIVSDHPSGAGDASIQSGISPEVNRVLATVSAVAHQDRAE